MLVLAEECSWGCLVEAPIVWVFGALVLFVLLLGVLVFKLLRWWKLAIATIVTGCFAPGLLDFSIRVVGVFGVTIEVEHPAVWQYAILAIAGALFVGVILYFVVRLPAPVSLSELCELQRLLAAGEGLPSIEKAMGLSPKRIKRLNRIMVERALE